MSAPDDIRREAAFEILMAQYFAKKLGGLIQPKAEGRDKEKDFVIYMPMPIEIKNDRKAETTGNMYFEVRNCRLGEPSGLTATKAFLVAHFVPPKTLFSYKPKEMCDHLRREVKAGNPAYRYLKGCGDNNSNGVLVAISIIEALAFVEKELIEL